MGSGSLRSLNARSRVLSGQSGQALLLTIIILAVLVIAAGAIATAITSNQNTSANDKQGTESLGASEAGLTLAANWVASNDANGSQGVGSTTSGSGVIPGDGSNTYTATWTAKKDSASQWTLTSTSTSGTGKTINRRVTQVKMTATTSPGGTSNVWNYGFVMGGDPYQRPAGGGGLTPYDICENGAGSTHPTRIENSGGVTVPVWINGDLCTSGGSDPAIGNGSSGPITVHVGGFVYGSNGPSYIIGKPAAKVDTMDIAATGCYDNHYKGGIVPLPGCDYDGVHAATDGSGYSGVFATHFASLSPVSTYTPNDTAENAEWAAASPGPKNPCNAGMSTGTWPTTLFDNNAGGSTAPDSSLDKPSGPHDLVDWLGTNTFDCKTASGELQWTPPATNGQLGTLKIIGAVFLDGSFTMSSADLIVLDSATNGTLYIDGSMYMDHNASICAIFSTGKKPACSPVTDGWAATGTPILGLSVYNRSKATKAFDMEGDSRFEGDAFVNGQFYLGNSANVSGSVFATYADIVGDGHFQKTTLQPAQNPIPTGTNPGWAIAPGTWRQCPASAGCS